MTSQILKLTLAFLSSCFPKRPKNSVQKFKYRKNKKRNEKHSESLTVKISRTIIIVHTKVLFFSVVFIGSITVNSNQSQVGNNRNTVQVIEKCYILKVNVAYKCLNR